MLLNRNINGVFAHSVIPAAVSTENGREVTRLVKYCALNAHERVLVALLRVFCHQIPHQLYPVHSKPVIGRGTAESTNYCCAHVSA